MARKNLVILIIIGLVVFVVGGGVGVMYQKSKTASVLPEENPVYKILSSKLIPTITAFGKISSINGNDIVLSSGDETLNIEMKDSAPVYIFDSSVDLGNGLSTPSQKIVNVDVLKEGQDISVNLKINKDGQISGVAIVLISYP